MRSGVFCSIYMSGMETCAIALAREGDLLMPLKAWDKREDKSLLHQIAAWASPANPYPHEMNDPFLKQGLGLRLFISNETESGQVPRQHPVKAFLPKGSTLKLVGKLNFAAIHLTYQELCRTKSIDWSAIGSSPRWKEACDQAFRGDLNKIRPAVVCMLMGLSHAPKPTTAELMNA